jgi:hypothetical protein
MLALTPDRHTIGVHLILGGLKKKPFASNRKRSVGGTAIGRADHVDDNALSGPWLSVEDGDKRAVTRQAKTSRPNKVDTAKDAPSPPKAYPFKKGAKGQSRDAWMSFAWRTPRLGEA